MKNYLTPFAHLIFSRISKKVQLTAVVLLAALISLSCSLGQLAQRALQPGAQETRPTITINEPTSHSERPTQPALPSPTPESAISPLGFAPGDALVWLTPEGQIVFQHPNGRLQTASLNLPKSDWWGLAYMAQQVTVTPSGVYFLAPSLESSGLSLIVATPDGNAHPVSPPPMQGIFTAAFPSPDGSQIVWLEDVSPKRPSMTSDPECELDPECIGWVFNIHVTDAEGGADRQSIRFETGSKAIGYGLSLSNWNQDGETVYLKGAVNLESAVYPSIVGELFAVNLTSGKVSPLASRYEALAISPDGRWNASITYDSQERLTAQRDDGKVYEVTFPAGTLADQAVFSPQSDSLLFIQLEGKSTIGPRSSH